MNVIRDKIPTEKAMMLKNRLREVPDEKADAIMCTDLHNPTHILLFSIFSRRLGRRPIYDRRYRSRHREAFVWMAHLRTVADYRHFYQLQKSQGKELQQLDAPTLILKSLRSHAVRIAVVIAYALIIGCPLRRLTGISCPFCGMTRAYLLVFTGDISGAFSMHSLFPLGVPFVLGITHLRILKSRRSLFALDIVFVAFSSVTFILRYALLH